MRRRILAGALLAALATGASAAPLCRSGKGMFTPCPPAVVAAARSEKRKEAVAKAEDVAKPVSERRRPGLFAKGKLCRDVKGLYTPCA